MKQRLILFGMIFFLSAELGYAQDRFFKADFHLGPNFTQVDGDRLGGYNKIGFFAGLGISHQFTEKVGGEFEINYTQKGSKTRVDPKDPNPQIVKLSFDYIEFPVMIDYDFGQFNAFGGPSIGVNVRSLYEDLSWVATEEIKPLEWAVQLGLKKQITDAVTVEGRYSYSLIRIANNYPNGLNVFNRVGLYNRLFTLSLAYELGN